MNNTDNILRNWLQLVGLRFDPLLPLDAAQDPRLSEYRVGHSIFSAIWGDWVSFVFAPPGGGKTALRVNTAQSCWVGQGTNRPFSVSYTPPFLALRRVELSWEEHLAALSRATSQSLLLGLACRPHWFLDLDRVGQRAVRRALDWNLPGPLRRYLAQCTSSESIDPLRASFDPVFQINDPPESATLLRFCAQLEAMDSGELSRPAPVLRWQQMTDVILNVLGFRALYALIDGLDSVIETWRNPSVAVNSIADMLVRAGEWSEQRVFVKGFFPSATHAIVQERFPGIAAPDHLVTIQWTPALLAEVIRKRLYVASDGAYNSLNAIGSSGLPGDAELLLAQSVAPLPRELLVLTREVFLVHVARRGLAPSFLELEPEDFDEAIDNYRQNDTASGEANSAMII